MTAVKEQAISLLVNGLSTSQVAAACGVTDAYISQLKADPEVSAQLEAAGAEMTLQDVAFDSRLESAESLALDRIEKSIGFANMGQALHAFKVLNGARKRRDVLVTQDTNVSIHVSLTLPAQASANYVINNKNEIIEVEGQTMATATPKAINEMLANRGTPLAQITALTRAADRLSSVQTMSPRPPRRLPNVLSADIL